MDTALVSRWYRVEATLPSHHSLFVPLAHSPERAGGTLPRCGWGRSESTMAQILRITDVSILIGQNW